VAKAGGETLSSPPVTPTPPELQPEPLVVPIVPPRRMRGPNKHKGGLEVSFKRPVGRPRKNPLSPKEKLVGIPVPDEEIDQPRRWKNAAPKNPSLKLAYDPHPKQQVFGEAIKNGAKIVLFLAGIRSGKSFAGAFECLKLIYEAKKLPNLGYIVTPTVNMGRVPRRLFINAAGKALLRYKRASDDGPPNCQMMPFKGMPAKAYIVEFHSGEHPDRLRGAAPAWAWLDEAMNMKPEVYDIILGRVMENDGVILITTSPSTKSHWTYTEIIARAARCGKCRNFYHDHKYRRVENKLILNDHEPTDLYCDTVGVKPDTSIAVIQCATFDNTHLKEDLIKSLELKYTLKDHVIARRELYGEVCGFEGLVYRSFDRDTHRSDFTAVNVPPEAEIVAGIDFGVNDPFVVSFLARVRDTWHVVDEYYWQGEPRSIKQHVDEMKRRCRLFNRVKRWWYDPSGKQQSIELQQCGLRNIFKARKRFATGVSWIRFRIDTINSLLLARDEEGQPLLRVSRACPGIIGDFESRKWKRYTVVGDDDRVRVMDQKGKEVDRNAGDEPAPGYDHGTDATEYALVSEVVAGRYQIKSQPKQVNYQKDIILNADAIPVQGPTAKYLADSLSQHATALAKPKTTRDAWSFGPRWS